MAEDGRGCKVRTFAVGALSIVRVWWERSLRQKRGAFVSNSLQQEDRGEVRTRRAADDTPPSVSTEVAFVADADESFRSHIRITYWTKFTPSRVNKGKFTIVGSHHLPSHFSHRRPMAIQE